MTKITLKEAVGLIKNLFDVTPANEKQEGKSFYTDEACDGATFFFDKRQYSRGEVVNKLVSTFSDKVIEKGQVRIDNITLVFTMVYVEHRNA